MSTINIIDPVVLADRDACLAAIKNLPCMCSVEILCDRLIEILCDRLVEIMSDRRADYLFERRLVVVIDNSLVDHRAISNNMSNIRTSRVVLNTEVCVGLEATFPITD